MIDVASERRSPFDDLVAVVRWTLIVVGVAAAIPVVITLVLRQVDVTSPRAVGYLAATPLITFCGVGAVVLLVAARWWSGAMAAGALSVVLVLTQVPLYLGTAGPDGPSTEVAVLTVNLRYGGGDPDRVVEMVDGLGVDVLALQELTPAARTALGVAGLDERLPHSVVRPENGVGGNGLWSRYPLDELPHPDDFIHPPVAARMDVDGQRVFVAVVHPTSPYPGDADLWALDFDRLEEWLSTVDGPAIVAGDFNATHDHRPFRDVLATGLRDAAEQVGAGFLPTYPAGRRRIPLLITIDHVLSGGGIVAVDVRRVDVPGSDHAGVLAVLAVPSTDEAVPS